MVDTEDSTKRCGSATPRAGYLLTQKKIANFLHGLQEKDFQNLNPTPLPSDRSRLDIHAMVRPMDIAIDERAFKYHL